MSINVDELSDLIKQATKEILRLRSENQMLTDECNALRQQVSNLERQVYNGNTF